MQRNEGKQLLGPLLEKFIHWSAALFSGTVILLPVGFRDTVGLTTVIPKVKTRCLVQTARNNGVHRITTSSTRRHLEVFFFSDFDKV